MESLRRRFKSTAKDPWATNLRFDPEMIEVSELPAASSVLLTARPHPSSNDVDMRDYYMGIIHVALEHGGSYHGQQISIPWLKMTLAGLEMRPVPAEMMWEGEEDAAATDLPGYEVLFPTERAS